MCGRFTPKESMQHLTELFGLPVPPVEMEAIPVSAIVNNPRNDLAECVSAIG